MKKLVFLICSLLISFASHSQNPVPNGDFEIWTNVKYPQPTGWLVNNSNIPTYLIATPITQSSDAHTGVSAFNGEVVTAAGASGSYGPSTNVNFSVTKIYASVNFWYKLAASGTDALHIVVYFYDHTHTLIGGGEDVIDVSTSQYTFFSVPVKDTSLAVATSCTIVFELVNPANGNHTYTTTLGSNFTLDDVSLSDDPTIVSSIGGNRESISFPNPVHDRLYVNIPGQNHEGTLLTLIDPSGRIVVEKKSMETTNEKLNVAHLSAGIYTLLVRSPSENVLRKIVVQ